MPASAQYHQPIEGRVDSSQIREGSLRETGFDPRASYRTLDSLVMANRMGVARAFADSILPSIPRTSPYHDSVRAKRAYLEDLLTRRTRPAKAKPRTWSLETGIVAGWESFQWIRGRSTWARTRADSWEVASGMVADPTSATAPIAATTGAAVGGEGSASWTFATGPLVHRLEASGRWGLSREDSTWKPGWSHVSPRVATSAGSWEGSLAPAWQWSGEDLVLSGISGAISWTTRELEHPWILSLEGGVDRLEGQNMTYRRMGAEVAHRRRALGWLGRIGSRMEWTNRTGVARTRVPVRVASCDDLQDGEIASATSIVCYASPTSDSVLAPHPFKGLSAVPYVPGVDLERGSWTSSIRTGTTMVLFRPLAKGRAIVQIATAYVFERSLDAVRWNNGYFGNALGDSLYVYHDRATDRDFLWEKDLRSRFLGLERRAEALSLHTVAGQIRGGFRPVAGLELHLEYVVGRTWSSLPDEAEERGNFRWQIECGASWEW
ncbi:MAG: hypothetical protein IPK50_03760 [Fibrobacterota bacterium]|nr:MAG: hypothetical protein IPK50_03760 [Fibrobacterota bacterium]